MLLLLAPLQLPPAPDTGTPIGLLLALTRLPASATVLYPDSIASSSAVGQPILIAQSDLDTIATAWRGSVHPLFRFIVAGSLVIDEDRLLLYEEAQTGRLGRAEVEITLDNHDDALTAYLGTTLTPRKQVRVLIGAQVDGSDYRYQRHTLTILDIAPVNFKDATSALRLHCENNWDKFRKPATVNLAWTDTAIGAIVDDIAASVGVTLERDAGELWDHILTAWKAPAGLPPQPIVSDLIGDGERTHSLASGRFDPEGKWILAGLYPNPASDLDLSEVYDSSISYRGDVATRYQITGSASQVTGSAPELEILMGEQRIHITNAYALASTDLEDRLLQEATEHRERYLRGNLMLRPDPRVQLWHVVRLYGVASIADGTLFRATEIRFTYGAGQFSMMLTLRSVTPLTNTTAVDVIPTIEPPPPPVPSLTPAPDATVSDDFDAYDDDNPLADSWSAPTGLWNVYEDTTDAAPCTLGQTQAGSSRYTALCVKNYVALNWFYGGIYLKAEGAAGLLAFAINESNCYEIAIDSTANTVSLIRWINGMAYTLHTHSQTISINVPYMVGLWRHGHHLRAYCKSLTSTHAIFSATHLTANKTDIAFLQGRLGFSAYGIAARFFSARAGVQFAVEYSDRTHPHGHHHCSGPKWYDCDGTADRGPWHTDTCTLPELAHRVKALIDDLRSEHLIHD